MAITITTAVIVGVLSLLLFLFSKRFSVPASLRLPPGPQPLPIVGNLLMVRKYTSPHDLATYLKRQYGPILTIWMGSKPWIILSEPEIIREAMITQGRVFQGRDQPQTLSILTDGHRNLLSGDGERTKFFRLLLVSEVLSNKRVAGFRPIREREVDILVESLKMQLSHNKNGRIITNFRSLIQMSVYNLIFGILFGRRLTLKEYVELHKMIDSVAQALGKLRDFIPLLSWLPQKNVVTAQLELRKRLAEVLEPYIEERKQVLKSGKTYQPTVVDTLLELHDGKIQCPIEILDKDVEMMCVEILLPGTESTAYNLEYGIANLINHPEMQEKLAQEISAVVGKRVVDEDDIPRLPYLQAVVKENLRRHNPVPLVPRRALTTTKLAGYDIPENAIVLQHVESVCLSPKIWEDPLEFRPERLLNKTLDITGSHEITMIPFGVGRRICPGINIAFLHTELILARLIQAFDWKPAIPGQLLDLSPSGGFPNSLKYPLVASLQERKTFS